MVTDRQAYELIMQRRSIRQYQDKPVEREKIMQLLKCAMAAPSACNLQPWEFVVVTDKEKLAQIRAAAPGNRGGEHVAPLAIVICANTKNIPWGGSSWMIDCSAAVENMMLMAVALGLGSVWIGSAEEEKIRAIIGLPEDIRYMNVIYFGYPAEERPCGSHFDESAIYWEAYDKTRERKLRDMDMLSDINQGIVMD